MLRTITDRLNLATRTQSLVQRQHPDELVLFSTAVTILESRNESPTGWSLKRFFQRRGNVVITDARIFVQSSFLSLLTVMWVGMIGLFVDQYLQHGHDLSIVLALVAVVFVFQRRPYARDLPFPDIHRIQFGSVRGRTGRGDILSIVVDGGPVQLVTAQFVPDDVRERLATLNSSGAQS